MLAGGFIKQRVVVDDVKFVEHLEENLSKLPLSIQNKLKKVNFLDHAFDMARTSKNQEQTKRDIVSLLEELIGEDYHPIYVGRNIGFYLYDEAMPLERLKIFKELYDPQSAQTQVEPASIPLVVSFSRLLETAKPGVRQESNCPKPNKASLKLTMSG